MALIVVRLFPAGGEAMSGADFAAFLTGLTIRAVDLNVSAPEAQIGVPAAYTAPQDPAHPEIPHPSTTIVQHTSFDILTGFSYQAAATAVIAVAPPNPPASRPEHATRDIRLEITRNGTIVDRRVYMNVPEATGTIPANRALFPGLEPTGLYLGLPGPGRAIDPADAYVELPADGSAPPYDQVLNAVARVLGDDPGGTLALAPLTVNQARHVAREIVWNQKFRPLPGPTGGRLGDLYTNPTDDGENAERGRFEATLTAYYATGDADAERLTTYVVALATAVECEARSTAATEAGLTFPVLPGQTATGERHQRVRVKLTAIPAASRLTVPARYFYALGAGLPATYDADQRYRAAILADDERLRTMLVAARDAHIIAETPPSSPPGLPAGQPPVADAPPVGIAAAVRRLRALGDTGGSPASLPVTGDVQALLNAWRAVGAADIDAAFWDGIVGTQPSGHLELVMCALTRGYIVPVGNVPLRTKLRAALGIGSATAAAAVQEPAWRAAFRNDPAWPANLPDFTRPGSDEERLTAFVAEVRKFFTLAATVSPVTSDAPGAPPLIRVPSGDPVNRFTAAYAARAGSAFVFGGSWDAGHRDAAVADVAQALFPGDARARRRLDAALRAIDELTRLAAAVPEPVRFSVMEALYARGFTTRDQIAALTGRAFRDALTGTVAFDLADALMDAAGGPAGESSSEDEPFTPVNPDGCLVDCVPPEHLSPFGPVAYLHALLSLPVDATCDDPGSAEAGTLGGLVSARRGPLGDLAVTSANATTPLPVVDLANECLEALAADPGSARGAVHDTATGDLAGHRLGGEDGHDPATLFAALPEHSTPAVPVAVPAAYEALRQDAAHPLLPYVQGLDVNRSHLEALGTCRYEVTRAFRRDITELALDPALEPEGFRANLWRLPLRLDLALEYLCLSREEYEIFYARDLSSGGDEGGVRVWRVYGFPGPRVGRVPWTQVVVRIPEFLERTGITWCDLIDLWRARIVPFGRLTPHGEGHGDGGEGEDPFPECEPCHLDRYALDFGRDPEGGLRRIAVVIRLWRTLRGARLPLTAGELADVVKVLGLFDSGGSVDPAFVRQLAAFQLLRDEFGVPLRGRPPRHGATGTARTPLLALWTGPDDPHWDWAVGALLDAVRRAAVRRYRCRPRPAEFLEVLAANLGPLSRLAGFDPDTPADTWHARPAHTLRFAEVLAKLYASDLGVGELLFLTTTDDHLQGDDPFPLQPPNEALDDPLALPDDDGPGSLWSLRAALLAVTGDADHEKDGQGETGPDRRAHHEADDGSAEAAEAAEGAQGADAAEGTNSVRADRDGTGPGEASGGRDVAAAWTWTRIDATLRARLGYAPVGDDPLYVLGARFFPSVLESEGVPVPQADRRWRVELPGSPPAMWNTPADGPFRYVGGALTAGVPLRTADVIAKLARVRRLTPAERTAVRELVAGPRAVLAPFGFLFEDFEESLRYLAEEADERRRFAHFQHAVARTMARCHAVAGHLAAHVHAVTGRTRQGTAAAAFRLLAHLHGDENRATGPWESADGHTPDVTWPRPTGGAFAALLALTGTGLLGEFSPAGGAGVVWRELRGPLRAFGVPGDVRDTTNAPVPGVIPALDVAASDVQGRFIVIRNGFAMSDAAADALGGAQGYTVRWTGSLLVEEGGRYAFWAGAPVPDGEIPPRDGTEGRRWRVVLRRGQRTWVLLAKDWPGRSDAPRFHVDLDLRRGAYDLEIEFARTRPDFDDPDDIVAATTGFQLSYAGPDSGGEPVAVPRARLYRRTQEPLTLDAGIEILTGNERAGLAGRYTGSLRDIRRTYQRAFKALLLAHRLGLSADPVSDDGGSELDHLLARPDRFSGAAYHRDGGGFAVHLAGFDPGLLPVADPYLTPGPALDQRAAPSVPRRQALTDWWERLFDYTVVRAAARTSPERPLWLLFHESAEEHPDLEGDLLRYLGVSPARTPLVLRYRTDGGGIEITSDDLVDERWPVRVWHADLLLRKILRRFLVADIRAARPDLWADADPGAPPDQTSGNANLTRFVADGLIENGRPRRYADLAALSDGLRARGRAALLAHLTRLDRVTLPTGEAARRPEELAGLLLIDVEAGPRERATRVEEAIGAVQTFVNRARLGLEPGFTPAPGFLALWDARYARHHVWEACERRRAYRENWVDVDELAEARRSEAFAFLEDRLRRVTLTRPEPGGLEYWAAPPAPEHPGVQALQVRDPSTLRRVDPRGHGFELLGTPDRHARPSWLAALGTARSSPGDTDGEPGHPPGGVPGHGPEGGPGQPPGGVPGHASDGGPGQPPGGVPGHAPEGGPGQPPGDVPDQGAGSPPGHTPHPLPAGDHGPGPRADAVHADAVRAEDGNGDRDGDGNGDGEGSERGSGAGLVWWVEAAVRLGTRFLRVAAAGEPPADGVPGVLLFPDTAPSSCCAECGREHGPLVDEYYFWLADARWFAAPQQDSLWPWHDPEQLPTLLAWRGRDQVRLAWCRVHHGEFGTPRFSAEGVRVTGPAALLFTGRADDSLTFTVQNGQTPTGHPADPPPGFRYDLASDDAIALPQVPPPPPPLPPTGPVHPGGLPAYPYFAYHAPGAPLTPRDPYGPALAVAAALRAHCRPEAALRWYELAFDPLRGDASWLNCGRDTPHDDDPQDAPAGGRRRRGKAAQEAELRAHRDGVRARLGRCCADSTAASEERVRRRSITLHYLETLLEWGDAWLRHRPSPESFAQARVLFAAAARLLGERPRHVVEPDGSAPGRVDDFRPHPAPPNPRLLSLYDLVADRLALIRACLTAERLPARHMPYLGATGLVDGWVEPAGTAGACPDDDVCLPASPYRFAFQISRARELAAYVRTLGAALQQAYERGDAEYLQSLRADHERQLQASAIALRQAQWRDADWQVQALAKTKQIAQTNRRYYAALVEAGLNRGENDYQALTEQSVASHGTGIPLEATGQALGFIPDIWLGVAGLGPLNANQLPLGTKLAGVFATAARIAGTVGTIASITAGERLTQAGWERREEEWRHQVEVLDLEIEQIERQILGAERRRDAALHELNDQRLRLEQALDVEQVLRDRLTGHALYLWLQRETAALYWRAYELALRGARQAQRAFNFERGHTGAEFLDTPLWDGLHEGLLAGERLELAVRRMEQTYLDLNVREYELVKHISLRLDRPLEFLRLQTTGACEIDLPEWLFDQDYPGHYMRRVRNVSLSIPCVVGPYTGVHARLTLLSSTTRVRPELIRPPGECCPPEHDRGHRPDCPPCGHGAGCGCRTRCGCRTAAEPPGDGYTLLPGDPRAVREYAAREAVATSTGQADPGVFEVNFRDERYLPFEYHGAVSRWLLELPQENNRFDLATVSDVILHLNYTAREGGEALREAATRASRDRLPGDGLRVFDVEHDLPDAWYALQRRDRPRTLPLSLSRAMFPFRPDGEGLRVEAVEFFIEAPHADPSHHHTIRYRPPRDHGGHGGDERHRQGRREEADEFEEVSCVASADWPGLFHGVLTRVGRGVLTDHESSLGTVEVPDAFGRVCRVWLLCGYVSTGCAPGRCACPGDGRPCGH
ncbi:hypothetical protein Ssi03_06500 [Sphaerisporangium siamense]|uniref:Insecticidal toxin complex protein n=1 Tax=Sphaerisporangium siamense TaxID=795645 RepID=A0A7W7DFH7_9ACTN|nr:neuraminidase-like domain-containing protein [Sphaerisporangium siamense]MBB4705945.1 hypothetical protein [Sphaerisporangium siamense]GII82660.1 hypothetical protein Ssi03_06500 [Sphaerisporangium siamense]